jgi:hypothetical protein
MFEKISVLVPTRGRVERLRTLLDSFKATVVGEEAELVFRIDYDDIDTISFLAAEGWISDFRPGVMIGPRLKGYESLPTFFNELVLAASGDVLMCGNDDMVFKTHGWARLVLEEANKHPDGLFAIGVRTHNKDHYPFAAVSKKAVDQMGFLFDPRIFWGDLFLRDTMAAFDRCIMLPHVEIDHDWAGNRPDQVFQDGEGARRGSWMGRHGEAVDDAVRKLRELIA